MIISLKYAQPGPWSTIVILMLHSESCDDGHFFASTALGGHPQGMARLFETRSFYAERFAPDQWLQRSPGRLRLARKPVFFVALKDCLRLEKGLSKIFQAAQDPKPGSWQQVKDVISIFRVQSLTLKQILGLSTLRKPFPISTFWKYIGALTLNSSLDLLVMHIIGLNC